METIIDPKIDFVKLILEATLNNSEKVFEVRFWKKHSTAVRNMTCRYGVKTGNGIDTVKHQLIVVWDVEKEGFRSIPTNMIIQVIIDGKCYRHWVEQEAELTTIPIPNS